MTNSIPLRHRLIVPTFQTYEIIDTKDIIAIQAYENYSKLQLSQNRHYISTQAFGKFVEMLEPFNFYQCHKSFIVNIDLIKRYYKSGEVEMDNGIKIPVARRRKEEFLEVLYTKTVF